jgi:hypothetical protein
MHWPEQVPTLRSSISGTGTSSLLGTTAWRRYKRKRSFPPLSILEMIILPRHARDKHRESTHKRPVLSQETCRDLGHTSMFLSSLINFAETAYHQGIDLYAENTHRFISGIEFHASLMADEPAPFHQPRPHWLCGTHKKTPFSLPFARLINEKNSRKLCQDRVGT